MKEWLGSSSIWLAQVLFIDTLILLVFQFLLVVGEEDILERNCSTDHNNTEDDNIGFTITEQIVIRASTTAIKVHRNFFIINISHIIIILIAFILQNLNRYEYKVGKSLILPLKFDRLFQYFPLYE